MYCMSMVTKQRSYVLLNRFHAIFPYALIKLVHYLLINYQIKKNKTWLRTRDSTNINLKLKGQRLTLSLLFFIWGLFFTDFWLGFTIHSLVDRESKNRGKKSCKSKILEVHCTTGKKCFIGSLEKRIHHAINKGNYTS